MFSKYLGKFSRSRTYPVEPGKTKQFLDQKGATSEADKAAMAGKDFLGLIGCLSYIVHQTRLDCNYHVNFLSQFMANPSVENYDNALGVLAYLYQTRDLCLNFGCSPPEPVGTFDPPLDKEQFEKDFGLHAWSDASWSQPSQCGHVIMRGGCAVAWSSRKLRAIAMSSTEAEMCAGVAATKDIIFVRNVLTFMGKPPNGPTPLMIDNKGMWFNVRNSGVSARTRHWEMWQQFVREAFTNLKIAVLKTPGNFEVADILTKPAPREAHLYKSYRGTVLNSAPID